MKTLFIIPARGGSKGIPHKNIKPLCGKPLIHYSIEVARELANDNDICVSTDDQEIIATVEKLGLKVPFVRPAELASDTATTNDVIIHALNYYKENGIEYSNTVLLQPTSPMRTAQQVKEAMDLYDDTIDMVVSVRRCENSVTIFREDSEGFLIHAFDVSKGIRRQDALPLFEYNGAIYVINNQRLVEKGLQNFDKNRKYVMDEKDSVDIDNELDWIICESIMKYAREK
ncbi:N-acylneuraminate cytidylyltransferase [Lachnospiraceae bacterium YSD2013]|nr:N-acylneuraminate cytidylyltransferase [Lachnospiraceae bacterium YSD2013]